MRRFTPKAAFGRLSAAAVALSLGLLAGPVAAQTTFTITVDTGPNHIRNITLRSFMERLSEATGGELVAELYESGQLYAARDEARAVARGDVQMSVTTNSALSAFASDLNALDMPLFVGLTPEQLSDIIDGPFGQLLAERTAEQLDVVVPGRWFLLGYADTFGAGRDFASFDDYQGARVRIFGGAAFIARLAALGAEGLAIPFPDVPLALTNRTIDGLLTTSETVRSGQLYESGVRSAFTDNAAVLFYIPVVNRAFFDGLSEAHRAAFLEAWDSVIDEQRSEALRRQAEAREHNSANGIVYTDPSPEELAEANAKLQEIVPQLVTDLGVDPAVVALAREMAAAATN
jgi:C4-dicarboxylate-binding protein DctP